MKQIKYSITGILIFLNSFISIAQNESKIPLTATIQYFAEENKTVYLKVTAKAKIQGRFRNIPGINVYTYLDAEKQENVIDSATTESDGFAVFYLPVRLKEKWEASSTHTFIAIVKGNDTLDNGSEEIAITKAKLKIDTSIEDGIHNIILSASALENGNWIPIKDLEIKPGVKRIGGLLKVTEEETYTTDSSGKVVIEFLDSLIPGDSQGNISLGAKVEDNDSYGNLIVSQQVKWGKPSSQKNDFFDKRTLYSTRFHTPVWLLVIVYGMAIGIWGAIFSILRKLFRIIKLGKA